MKILLKFKWKMVKRLSLISLSSSGDTLTLKRQFYTCTCKGFISQRASINERTFSESSVINVSLLLADNYNEKVHDPVGWWISEKLDGVRAFWNGRRLYSRNGNAFNPPEWFTKDLPKDMHLDGELFGGRGMFQSTCGIARSKESSKWKEIRCHVFDSPNMGKEVFEKRMEKIKEYFETSKQEYAVFAEQIKCTSKEHLDEELTRILNLGGEGLMIRQPKSVYKPCRSKTLLKVKWFYTAETLVVRNVRGKGLHQDRCRASLCRMACGTEFYIGYNYGQAIKHSYNPSKPGSIIKYKFQELYKSGKPRFATFVDVCDDKSEPRDAEIRTILD